MLFRSSEANAEVTTEAKSALPEEKGGDDDGEEMSLEYVKKLGMLLLKKAAEAAGEKNEVIAKITAGLGLLDGEYAIESCVTNDTDKGSVSFSEQYADKGDEVTAIVTPAEGYTVETLRMRYLVPGATEYTYETLNAEEGTLEYKFTMPGYPVDI